MRGWRTSKPACSKLAGHGVVGAAPLPVAYQAGEAGELLVFEAERLAYFARRGTAAIADDVGGHGCAELAIALVDVLDDLLAVIAGGQIEIDVGPFAAVLAQEALEEQFHADRIDSGDFKRIADGGVGCRAAPLHQNAVLLAVAHDLPDDEKVAGKA